MAGTFEAFCHLVRYRLHKNTTTFGTESFFCWVRRKLNESLCIAKILEVVWVDTVPPNPTAYGLLKASAPRLQHHHLAQPDRLALTAGVGEGWARTQRNINLKHHRE